MNCNQQFLKYLKFGSLVILILMTITNIYLSVISKLMTSTITFHEYTDDRKLSVRDLPDIKICAAMGFNENGKLGEALSEEANKGLNESQVESLVQNHTLKLEDLIVFFQNSIPSSKYKFDENNWTEVWSTHFTGADIEGNCFTYDMQKGK